MLMSGKLFVVPTPIGNLEDITLRALKVLKEADVILAEDTRHSGVLLKHFGIETKMISYHQHNEHQLTKSLALRMKSGETMALISDAGTPGISDAAFLLVAWRADAGSRAADLRAARRGSDRGRAQPDRR